MVVDTSVNATFDKAMDPSTINPDTFTLMGPGATVVVGKVSYDVADQIATFTPVSPLAASTSFTATISGAKDLAGNALAITVWNFSTGTARRACRVESGSGYQFRDSRQHCDYLSYRDYDKWRYRSVSGRRDNRLPGPSTVNWSHIPQHS